MNKGGSLIVPIILILIAFFFVEKYTKKINILNKIKNTFYRPIKNINYKKIAKKVEREVGKSIRKHLENNSQEETPYVDENTIYHENTVYDEATNEYPLNINKLIQTQHYVTDKINNDNSSIKLSLTDTTQKNLSEIPEVRGHQTKEHFSYYSGQQNDYLYH